MNEQITKKPKSLKSGDIAVIVLVLLLAVSIFVFRYLTGGNSNGSSVRVVTADESYTLSLSQQQIGSIESNGYTMHYVIANGAFFADSCDCNDNSCVKTGKISKTGDSVICLPAHISVTVTGGAGIADADQDFIAG